MKGLPQTKHNQNDCISSPEEELMGWVILLHPRKIPDAKISCIWDDARLDDDAMCTSEYRVSDIGCCSSTKQAAEEVALEGVDQLCLPHPSCPTHEEFGSRKGFLAKKEFVHIVVSKIVLQGCCVHVCVRVCMCICVHTCVCTCVCVYRYNTNNM